MIGLGPGPLSHQVGLAAQFLVLAFVVVSYHLVKHLRQLARL
jgi:hypothetical protein